MISAIYIYYIKNYGWSGTSYRRIHFLPFTRDGRGYAQYTPLSQSLDLLVTHHGVQYLFLFFCHQRVCSSGSEGKEVLFGNDTSICDDSQET